MTNRIVRLRTQAFIRQSSLCFYCEEPMCDSDVAAFARAYGLTNPNIEPG